MAQYKIKKEKEKVVVEVTVPGLPPKASEAEKFLEVVRARHVRAHLQGQGIRVFECLESCTLCNYSGASQSGVYVFSTKDPAIKPKVEEKKEKDLTTSQNSGIMKENPKKRKRVKSDPKAGTETIS